MGSQQQRKATKFCMLHLNLLSGFARSPQLLHFSGVPNSLTLLALIIFLSYFLGKNLLQCIDVKFSAQELQFPLQANVFGY